MRFAHDHGDIDVYLYDAATGDLLDASNSVDDCEHILLPGLAGSYLLLIEGYAGQINPRYALNIGNSQDNSTESEGLLADYPCAGSRPGSDYDTLLQQLLSQQESQ